MRTLSIFQACNIHCCRVRNRISQEQSSNSQPPLATMSQLSEEPVKHLSTLHSTLLKKAKRPMSQTRAPRTSTCRRVYKFCQRNLLAVCSVLAYQRSSSMGEINSETAGTPMSRYLTRHPPRIYCPWRTSVPTLFPRSSYLCAT